MVRFDKELIINYWNDIRLFFLLTEEIASKNHRNILSIW